MTPSPPAVVVSLPARSVEEARRQAEEARAAGADLAEVRIDRFAADHQARLEELFPAPLPLIATYRSRVEGGEGSDDSQEREAILSSALRLPFQFVDLEWQRDRSLAAKEFPPGAPVPILSSHLIASEALRSWEQRLEELAATRTLGKLVFPASIGDLLGEVLSRLPSRLDGSVTVHTTGASGGLLRAWSRQLGLPMAYASLPEGEGASDRPPVEPSQVPVDRLGPFVRAQATPPLFGIAGRPVGHSLSPRIHHAWMQATHRLGLYLPLEFDSDEEFLASLGPLADHGFRGLNVTQPYKLVAFRAATRVGNGAAACGAANCLTFEEGEVKAENTDLAALLRRLEELRRAGKWDEGPIGVVGAGGAARATLAAARLLGVPASVFARRPEAAHQLAREFGATAGSLHGGPSFSLVVHATNAGRSPEGRLDVPLDRLLAPRAHVIDWVYRPDHAIVQQSAASRGATYEDGWRLLVYQAASSFALWWGSAPPEEDVQRFVEEVPCAA